MYAYRVRRDCFKCAVLCYTVGRREFERSTRHCMEFKIAKDKIVRWNKMFFWIKLRKYFHLAWFLLSIWPISSFLCDKHLKTPKKWRNRPNRDVPSWLTAAISGGTCRWHSQSCQCSHHRTCADYGCLWQKSHFVFLQLLIVYLYFSNLNNCSWKAPLGRQQ